MAPRARRGPDKISIQPRQPRIIHERSDDADRPQDPDVESFPTRSSSLMCPATSSPCYRDFLFLFSSHAVFLYVSFLVFFFAGSDEIGKDRSSEAHSCFSAPSRCVVFLHWKESFFFLSHGHKRVEASISCNFETRRIK